MSIFSDTHKVEIFDYLVSLKDPSKTSPIIRKLLSSSYLHEHDVDYLIFSLDINMHKLLGKYRYFIRYSFDELTQIVKGDNNLIKNNIFLPTTVGRTVIEPFIPINDEEFTNL